MIVLKECLHSRTGKNYIPLEELAKVSDLVLAQVLIPEVSNNSSHLGAGIRCLIMLSNIISHSNKRVSHRGVQIILVSNGNQKISSREVLLPKVSFQKK